MTSPRFSVTRRTFLVGSGVTTFARPAFGDRAAGEALTIRTQYDGDTLVAVRLAVRSLSNETTGTIDIDLPLFSPAPAGRSRPRLRIAGLGGDARAADGTIRCDRTIVVTMDSADLFLPGAADARLLFCELTLRASACVADTATAAHWLVKLRTNAFGDTLTFSEPGAPLLDVIRGDVALTRAVRADAVATTLSRLFGQPVRATGRFQGSFALARDAEGVDDDPAARRSIAWRVDGVAGGNLAMAGGAVRFDAVRFGWRGQGTGTEAEAAPRFAIALGADGAVGFGPYRATTARGTAVVLDAADQRLRAKVEAVERASDDGTRRRTVEVALAGDLRATIRAGERTLAAVDVTVAADGTAAMRLRQSGGRPVFDLQAVGTLVPRPRAVGLRIRPDPLSTDPLDAAREHVVHSLPFGPLVAAGATDDSELRLTAAGTSVDQFWLRCAVVRLPLGLDPDGDATLWSTLRWRPAGGRPYLLLDAVTPDSAADAPPEPDGDDRFLPLGSDLLRQFGHLRLDGDRRTRQNHRPAVDLPLSPATLSVRRAADWLALDFDFVEMRLGTVADGSLRIGPEAVRSPETVAPTGLSKNPALIVRFGPQSLAEQAFLRRNAPDLPSVPFDAPELPGTGPGGRIETLLAALRRGTRPAKARARRELLEAVGGWLTPEPDAVLKQRIEEFLTFTAVYGPRADAHTPPLPEDQRIYIGPAYLDPDALRLAYDVQTEMRGNADRKALLVRLLSIEAWGDDTNTWPPALSTWPEIAATDLAGLDDPTVRERHAALLAETPTQSADDLQRALMPIKREVAPDYAAFADFWDEHVSAQGREIDRFVSIPWARATDAVTLDKVLANYSAPGGEGIEPYEARVRARHSGPSRLAFEWARAVDGRLEDARFTLAALLDWQEHEMRVQRRAAVRRERDGDGRLVRVTDDAEMLLFQGLTRNATATTRMAEVVARANVAPAADETAIEFPFRLALSPAQDALWTVPAVVPRALLDPPGMHEVARSGVPMWTASLSTGTPSADLRAVWSPDFRANALSPTLATGTLDEAPPRGAAEPWALRPLPQADGEPAPPARRPFRASVDAFDRDQLVKLSSVPGLPVQTARRDTPAAEIVDDTVAFEPPPGFALLGLRTEPVTGADGVVRQRDFSAIYRPRALTFREFRLSALGGTVDLETNFSPPAAAYRADGESLFPALVVQRYRHRAVLGRDVRVEVVYKGYLFPFGHQASLNKVTERRYTQPDAGIRAGPTAYLVQRFFISVAQPVKSAWVDAPSGGRGWPCRAVEMITLETADLVDPLTGAPYVAGPAPQPVRVGASGRLALGTVGRGLVFWPRTSPHAGADVAFEFRIDGSDRKCSMPLLFVDNEAANHRATVAALCEYYNDIASGIDTRTFAPTVDPASNRVVLQHYAPRAYGAERSDGEASYETYAWVVGAEGRPGTSGLLRALPLPDGEPDILDQRGAALGEQRLLFEYSQELRNADQPPFYPFVQFAVVRLDRLGRVTGERTGPLGVAAYDAAYLRNGFAAPPGDEPTRVRPIEPFLDMLTPGVGFDAGPNGDRIGAIGRPAGPIVALARDQGPLTAKEEKAAEMRLGLGTAPPEFSAALLGPSGPTVSALGRRFPDLMFAGNDGEASITEVLARLLGASGAKLFGIFNLTEVINYAVADLKANVPRFAEVLEFGAGVAASLEAMRDELITPLRATLAALEATFENAKLEAGTEELTLASVYPDVHAAITGLRAATDAVGEAPSLAVAVAEAPRLLTSGRSLVAALDRTAGDPITPVAVGVRKTIGGKLAEAERLVADAEAVISELPRLAAGIEAALVAETRRQAEALLQNSRTQALSVLLPTTRAGTAGRALADALVELATGALAAGFAGSTTFRQVAAKLVGWRWAAALQRATGRLSALADVSGPDAAYLAAVVSAARQLRADERTAEELARLLLGVDWTRMRRQMQAVANAAAAVTAARDPLAQAAATVDLVRSVDALLLDGRYGRAVNDQLAAVTGDALKAIVGRVLDGYDAVLLWAEALTYAVPAARQVVDLKPLDDAAAALRDVAGRAAADVKDAMAAVDEALADLDADTTQLHYTPLRELARDLIEIEGAVLAIPIRAATPLLATLARDLATLRREVAGSAAAFAGSAGRAHAGIVSFRAAVEATRRLIATARREQTTTALRAAVDAFPRAQATQVLATVPRLAAALRTQFAGVARGTAWLRGLSDRLAVLATQSGRDDVGALVGAVEAAFGRFAAAVLRDAVAEVDRLRRTAADDARRKVREVADAFLREVRGDPVFAPIAAAFTTIVASAAAIDTVAAEAKLAALDEALAALSALSDADAATEARLAAAARVVAAIPTADDVRHVVTVEIGGVDAASREIAATEALIGVAALRNAAGEVATGVADALVGQLGGALRPLARATAAAATTRDALLASLATEPDLALQLRRLARAGGIGGADFDPAVLFVAVARPDAAGVLAEKVRMLGENRERPDDFLAQEAVLLEALAGGRATATMLRSHIARSAGRYSPGVLQIAEAIAGLLERLQRPDISQLVDFTGVKRDLADRIALLVPTALTTRMDFELPIQEFQGIFVPTGVGRFSASSVSRISFLPGTSPVEARSRAVLSPFAIKLLGSFDAISLFFSAATMEWRLGSEPTFDIDFLDYKIGEELEFVEQLASSLSASAGGLFVRPSTALLGVEAGYSVNVPAINLGATTFMNVALSASAILPFEDKPAQFAAGLSSRADPFIILAGIWGGGGHFQLFSDGRKITGFEASFCFGGGGAVSYGPLNLEGRVTIGVYIRKIGNVTEIAGDFFVGGSGNVACFSISASLTVTVGQDGSGGMAGSATFRYSFKVGFASISFAVTVAKREEKGFSSAGAEQAFIFDRSRRYADARGSVVADGPRIRVRADRADQDYAAYRSYFSNIAAMEFLDG